MNLSEARGWTTWAGRTGRVKQGGRREGTKNLDWLLAGVTLEKRQNRLIAPVISWESGRTAGVRSVPFSSHAACNDPAESDGGGRPAIGALVR